MRHRHFIVALAVMLVLGFPATAGAAVPPGVKPAVVTAYQWEPARADGIFREDGSTALDANGAYVRRENDRFEVEYREGLSLVFYNVGAMGGEQYAEARIDYVREYLTAGKVASGASGGRQAARKLKPYSQTLYYLRFTGGPDGTFTQTGGEANTGGPVTGQVVRDELDGRHYVELRPLFLRLSVDDPDVFKGWPGEEALPPQIGAEEEPIVEARLVAYRGRVTFVFPNGQRTVFRQGTRADVPSRLPVGTTITTGADSMLELEYPDGDRYVLGPDSSLGLIAENPFGTRLSKGRALVWHPGGTPDIGARTGMDFGVVSGSRAEMVLDERDSAASLVTLLAGDVRCSIPGRNEAVDLRPGEYVRMTDDGIGRVRRVDVELLRREWKSLREDAVELRGAGLLGAPGFALGAAFLVLLAGVGAVMYLRGRGIGFPSRPVTWGLGPAGRAGAVEQRDEDLES